MRRCRCGLCTTEHYFVNSFLGGSRCATAYILCGILQLNIVTFLCSCPADDFHVGVGVVDNFGKVDVGVDLREINELYHLPDAVDRACDNCRFGDIGHKGDVGAHSAGNSASNLGLAKDETRDMVGMRVVPISALFLVLRLVLFCPCCNRANDMLFCLCANHRLYILSEYCPSTLEARILGQW
jgi:hypothetical protein